jgi:hypothetical protein
MDKTLSRKTQQNTARIARTIFNVAVCRAFLRATLREVIDRQWIVIDRSRKNRPRRNPLISRYFELYLTPAVDAVDTLRIPS